MNCRQANRLMDDVLNGVLEHSSELEAHLAECDRCAAEWSALQRLARAARGELGRPVDEDRLERLTGSLLRALAAEPRPAPYMPLVWARAAAALGLLLAAFAGGVAVGHALWPTQRVTTRVVEKPYPVERVAKAFVPVVRERVVVRRVPVTRTRVVYREPPIETGPRSGGPAEPTTIDEVIVPATAVSFASRPLITQELAPVVLASEVHAQEGRTTALMELDQPAQPAWDVAQYVGTGESNRAEEGLDHATLASVGLAR